MRESGFFFKNKKLKVGAVSWWASMPKIKYSTVFDIKLGSGWQCNRRLIVQFFVANVNANGGELKANVNKFLNDNVWNGENQHRVVFLETQRFSSTVVEEFSFVIYFQVLFSSPQASCQFHLVSPKVQSISYPKHIYFPKRFARRILHHQV